MIAASSVRRKRIEIAEASGRRAGLMRPGRRGWRRRGRLDPRRAPTKGPPASSCPFRGEARALLLATGRTCDVEGLCRRRRRAGRRRRRMNRISSQLDSSHNEGSRKMPSTRPATDRLRARSRRAETGDLPSSPRQAAALTRTPSGEVEAKMLPISSGACSSAPTTAAPFDGYPAQQRQAARQPLATEIGHYALLDADIRYRVLRNRTRNSERLADWQALEARSHEAQRSERAALHLAEGPLFAGSNDGNQKTKVAVGIGNSPVFLGRSGTDMAVRRSTV